MSTRRAPATSFGLAIVLLLLAAACRVAAATVQRAAANNSLGVELDGLGDSSREKPFVDLAVTLRPWMLANSQPAPTDDRGWPTCDARTVLFDIRPFGAWLGPGHIDDPQAFQPDWSGTYHFAFVGRADVRVVEDARCRIEQLRYDGAANRTTGEIVVPKGVGLLVLGFSSTRRGPSAPANSGIADLRVIRPGYPADTREVFTREFLQSLKPFSVLRYMDWLETNHQPGYYGDMGHHALAWADRKRATDTTQQFDGRRYGVAWEYIVQLANLTGKDLWINIPIAATDDYVLQLARMLKRELSPHLRIYLEDSNEVWNFGFPQYIYNKLAAVDEVSHGGSNLANDGATDQEEWARRRHIRRVVAIGEAFRRVFGETGAHGRIRPIYASWVIYPDAYFANELAWVAKTYGPPGNYLYGIAGAAYFNAGAMADSGTPQQIVEAMRANSLDNRKNLDALQRIAGSYGVKLCQYEVGPDTGGGSDKNVANRIEANRLPAMRQVILEDARRWFAQGGDLYMYFSHCSAYSRYGCWGLSEDVANLNTPKWQAIDALAR